MSVVCGWLRFFFVLDVFSWVFFKIVVVVKVCKAKTVEQRTKIPGLPEKRADVIVGGAIILEEIFLALGIQKMKVSPYALREGVIVDALADTFANYTPGVNIRRVSVLNLASKFNTEQRMVSAQHSARLAKVQTYIHISVELLILGTRATTYPIDGPAVEDV